MREPTVEAVLQWTTGLNQLGAEHLLRRKNAVQDQAHKVVGDAPTESFPATEAPDSVGGPWRLELELLQGQSARTQGRWGRAAGLVIADEEEGP